jgi:hypothetical protein
VVLSGTVLALGQPATAVLLALFITVLAAVATAFVSALIAMTLKVESRRRNRRGPGQLPPGPAFGAGGQAAPPPSSADLARRPRRRSPGSLAVGPAS